jgi:RNA polymerase sigma factor (sigma-70 family)
MVRDVNLSKLTNAELVEGVIQRDYRVTNEFYWRFYSGLHHVMYRHGADSQDAGDLVHDTLFTVVGQIQKYGLNDPKRLAGFIHTIAKRNVWLLRQKNRRFVTLDVLVPLQGASRTTGNLMSLSDLVLSRELSPEQKTLAHQEQALMKQALGSMKPREIEILTRFYLNGESPEQIKREMNLNDRQYSLNKSRAKLKLIDATQKKGAGYSRERLMDRLAA